MNDAPSASATAGVVARPPLLYLAALVGGILLDRLIGWPGLSASLGLTPGLGWAIGAGCFALGGTLLFWAMGRFRAADTPVPTCSATRALVTDGPYRFSRNPIYLALTAIYLGLALALSSLGAGLLLLPLLLTMEFGVVRREERYLERRFGEDYRLYRRRVRRWL